MEGRGSTSYFRLRATGVLYRTGMNAPQILIQAQGRRAKRLLKLAEVHGVPIVQNPDLSFSLTFLPEGFEIPEDLYEAMALLLAGLETA